MPESEVLPDCPENPPEVGTRDDPIMGDAGRHCMHTASNTDKGMNQLRNRTPLASTDLAENEINFN
jgi:hypothetical protein